jgi:hypothetical protein
MSPVEQQFCLAAAAVVWEFEGVPGEEEKSSTDIYW